MQIKTNHCFFNVQMITTVWSDQSTLWIFPQEDQPRSVCSDFFSLTPGKWLIWLFPGTIKFLSYFFITCQHQVWWSIHQDEELFFLRKVIWFYFLPLACFYSTFLSVCTCCLQITQYTGTSCSATQVDPPKKFLAKQVRIFFDALLFTFILIGHM
jgi:hypothetical protein